MTGSGKEAPVAGGAPGLGLGIARRLGREDATLVLTGCDGAKLAAVAAELEQAKTRSTMPGLQVDDLVAALHSTPTSCYLQ